MGFVASKLLALHTHTQLLVKDDLPVRSADDLAQDCHLARFYERTASRGLNAQHLAQELVQAHHAWCAEHEPAAQTATLFDGHVASPERLHTASKDRRREHVHEEGARAEVLYSYARSSLLPNYKKLGPHTLLFPIHPILYPSFWVSDALAAWAHCLRAHTHHTPSL